MKEIKKHTYDLKLYKENSITKAFLDEAASITACGRSIALFFRKYIDDTTRSTITAGGMDAKETEKFYKSSVKFKYQSNNQNLM